jgi:7-cyano-7-deazaguanine synthase in queuosine biosynthesis
MGRKALQTTFTEPKKAVILLSGGVDSATTLALTKNEGYVPYALSFDYFQRHHRELESARLIASSLGVINHLVIRFDMSKIGGSALTSEIAVPKIATVHESGRTNKEIEARPKISHLPFLILLP